MSYMLSNSVPRSSLFFEISRLTAWTFQYFYSLIWRVTTGKRRTLHHKVRQLTQATSIGVIWNTFLLIMLENIPIQYFYDKCHVLCFSYHTHKRSCSLANYTLGFRHSTTMTSLINTVFLWTITIWYIYFFVSVGPTKVMIRDFWRMVWQKRVCKIVMLTNLMEACKVHFWKYILVSQQYVKFTSTVKLIISNFMGLKAHWFEIT